MLTGSDFSLSTGMVSWQLYLSSVIRPFVLFVVCLWAKNRFGAHYVKPSIQF